jgi:hypothetical protein
VDHTFVWEQISPLAGGPNADDVAFARMEIQVHGDEVSTYRIYAKLPEQWVREAEQKTIVKFARENWPYAFVVLIGAFLLTSYFRNLKLAATFSIPWKKLFRPGVFTWVAFLTTEILSWPTVLHSYQTQIPFAAYVVGSIAIGWLIGGVIVLVGVTFLFGLGWFFWARAGNAEKFPGWLNRSRSYYRDALVFTLAGGAAWMGYQRIVSLFTQKVIGASAEPVNFIGFDSLSPAAQSIAGALLYACLLTALVSALGGFVAVYVRSRGLQALLLVAAALAHMSTEASGVAFVVNFLTTLLELYLIWWVILKVIRFNLLAYFLLVSALALLNAGISLIAQPNMYLRNNGVIVLGALALLLLWPLAAWLRGAGDAASVPASS